MVSSPDSQGVLLEDFVKDHKALGGINASGYTSDTERGKTWGNSIVGGDMISRCPREDTHIMGGFTGEYKLVVGSFTDAEIPEKNYLWAFEFGPILVVNGEKTPLTEFSGGLAPRTAIGQTPDGAVLLVTADGRRIDSFGATYKDMQTILYANGAVNAIGLDGGSSSTMVYQGLVINRPSDKDEERRLPNAILFR
jgi:exopolysaccharide biosynthesis protein